MGSRLNVGVLVAGAVRRMEAIQKAADKEVWTALEQSARVIQASAARRAIVARQTNVQDDTRRQRLTGRSPVRVRLVRASMAALIVTQGFWTNARSAAIRNLYARHGLADKLIRRNLWVSRKRRGSRQQHDSRAGLTRLPLQGKLLDWAMGRGPRGDVGEQHLVSVVRPPGVVRRELVLDPAARQHNEATIQRIRAAVERAARASG